MKTLIEFENVCKSFGTVQAARNLSFQINEGHIHGLVGENGAGKSTAMKMVFGLERPDTGTVKFEGQVLRNHDATQAIALGIGMVHQHFMLAGPLSALDNLLLAEKGFALAPLDRKTAFQRYSDLCQRFGFQLDLNAKVEDLSVGAQQRLEILKVLARDPRVLIFDEPTAVLTPQEIKELLAQLRRLKDLGKTILLISHKLREILEITDEVTVFRRGQVVASFKTSETSAEQLAEQMIGRRLPPLDKSTATPGEMILEIKNLSSVRGTQGLHNLSFEIREGEIVGIAGVEGNGQDLLIRTLCEPQKNPFTGEISYRGKSLHQMTTADLRQNGAAFFPEDRLQTGVMANRPAWENFLLGHQNKSEFRRGLWLRLKNLKLATTQAMQRADVQPPDAEKLIRFFSGGNQQKFVVARELRGNPKWILAAHPTRGVDIGSVRAIHDEIRKESRTNRAAVLVLSSELEEILSLSDRVYVLSCGKLLGPFSTDRVDEIGLAMGGKAVAP